MKEKHQLGEIQLERGRPLGLGFCGSGGKTRRGGVTGGLYRIRFHVEGEISVETGIASVVSTESGSVTREEERKRGIPLTCGPRLSDTEKGGEGGATRLLRKRLGRGKRPSRGVGGEGKLGRGLRPVPRGFPLFFLFFYFSFPILFFPRSF